MSGVVWDAYIVQNNLLILLLTRLITSMNNCLPTNQNQAGLNWTNRKFEVVEGIRLLEYIVIIENNLGSCSTICL